jgi:Ras-related protein Rab-32
VAAFVVFDVTRIATFEAASKWKADIDDKVTVGAEEKPIPVVLLANKADLVAKEGLPKTARELDDFCELHGFAGWFETSAKENIGVDKAAKHLIQQILENTYTEKQEEQGVDLTASNNAAGGSTENKCCPW